MPKISFYLDGKPLPDYPEDVEMVSDFVPGVGEKVFLCDKPYTVASRDGWFNDKGVLVFVVVHIR